jgi:hypothetical protein
MTGRRPTNSGIRPNFEQILGLDLPQDLARPPLIRAAHVGPEADRGAATRLHDDLLEPAEGATADEQHVGGVDLQEFLLRVLAAALRRHAGDGAFHDLEQGLLHASPDTSRVIDGLSDLREILSTSSM